MDLKKYEKLNMEKELVELEDKIIIAMSGGPDSIYLYNLLKKISSNMKLTIYFAHINHSLRGEDSDSDEKFVKMLGVTENIETFTKKVDIKKIAKERNISEEEAGREIRYGFFRELKEKLGATKVALAHNEDDVVETFLFRLTRGTSLNGLEGIPVKREFFIRPILSYRKKEILNYLDSNNIKYCIDKTNFKEIYTRNKIRLNLIPTIEEEYNRNFKEKIINLISDITDCNAIINSSLKKYLKKDSLDIEELKEVDDFIRRSIISEYLQRYDVDLNRNKIQEINRLIFTDGTKEIKVSKKYRIKKTYDRLELVELKKELKQIPEKELLIPGSIIWNDYKISAETIVTKVKTLESPTEYYCNLKSGDILKVRSRKNGDKIQPIGMNGTQKIKDILINSKIPKEERELIPIITFLEEIVLVGGIRKSRKFKSLTENTVKLRIEKIRR